MDHGRRLHATQDVCEVGPDRSLLGSRGVRDGVCCGAVGFEDTAQLQRTADAQDGGEQRERTCQHC
jgi:hypothetical protein